MEHLEVVAALRMLPEEQREVVALHFLADLTAPAMAEELGEGRYPDQHSRRNRDYSPKRPRERRGRVAA